MKETPSKRYYTISEVAEMLEVKPHVLRYWESQFPALRPRKNRGGIRMYQEHDLDLLRTIREMLYDRGYTIAGAKRKLNEQRRQAAQEEKNQIDLDFIPPRDRKRLRQIRDELAALRDSLRREVRPRPDPAELEKTRRVAPSSPGRREEISVDPRDLPG